MTPFIATAFNSGLRAGIGHATLVSIRETKDVDLQNRIISFTDRCESAEEPQLVEPYAMGVRADSRQADGRRAPEFILLFGIETASLSQDELTGLVEKLRGVFQMKPLLLQAVENGSRNGNGFQSPVATVIYSPDLEVWVKDNLKAVNVPPDKTKPARILDESSSTSATGLRRLAIVATIIVIVVTAIGLKPRLQSSQKQAQWDSYVTTPPSKDPVVKIITERDPVSEIVQKLVSLLDKAQIEPPENLDEICRVLEDLKKHRTDSRFDKIIGNGTSWDQKVSALINNDKGFTPQFPTVSPKEAMISLGKYAAERKAKYQRFVAAIKIIPSLEENFTVENKVIDVYIRTLKNGLWKIINERSASEVSELVVPLIHLDLSVIPPWNSTGANSNDGQKSSSEDRRTRATAIRELLQTARLTFRENSLVTVIKFTVRDQIPQEQGRSRLELLKGFSVPKPDTGIIRWLPEWVKNFFSSGSRTMQVPLHCLRDIINQAPLKPEEAPKPEQSPVSEIVLAERMEGGAVSIQWKLNLNLEDESEFISDLKNFVKKAEDFQKIVEDL